MKKVTFNVNISPKEVEELIEKNLKVIKVERTENEVSEGRYIITSVYMTNVIQTFVLIAENVEDVWTKVKISVSGIGGYIRYSNEIPIDVIKEVGHIFKNNIVR